MKTLIAAAAILASVCGFFMAFAYGWTNQNYWFILGGLVLMVAPWLIAVFIGKFEELRDIVFPSPNNNNDDDL